MALGWAGTLLFGRVPASRQPVILGDHVRLGHLAGPARRRSSSPTSGRSCSCSSRPRTSCPSRSCGSACSSARIAVPGSRRRSDRCRCRRPRAAPAGGDRDGPARLSADGRAGRPAGLPRRSSPSGGASQPRPRPDRRARPDDGQVRRIRPGRVRHRHGAHAGRPGRDAGSGAGGDVDPCTLAGGGGRARAGRSRPRRIWSSSAAPSSTSSSTRWTCLSRASQSDVARARAAIASRLVTSAALSDRDGRGDRRSRIGSPPSRAGGADAPRRTAAVRRRARTELAVDRRAARRDQGPVRGMGGPLSEAAPGRARPACPSRRRRVRRSAAEIPVPARPGPSAAAAKVGELVGSRPVRSWTRRPTRRRRGAGRLAGPALAAGASRRSAVGRRCASGRWSGARSDGGPASRAARASGEPATFPRPTISWRTPAPVELPARDPGRGRDRRRRIASRRTRARRAARPRAWRRRERIGAGFRRPSPASSLGIRRAADRRARHHAPTTSTNSPRGRDPALGGRGGELAQRAAHDRLVDAW